MFENYKDCLFNDKIILKSQQRFKSDHHKTYTEKINKIAVSSDVDKRLQAFDKVATYLHETNVFKVCESEMLVVMKYKNFVLDDKNYIKETNRILKTIVAKCILNRLIRFCKGEMFTVMKYKYFLLDNINHIKETNCIFNVITKNWPYVPDYPYRILIIGGSGSGKTNALLNLIEKQPGIDKISIFN